MIIVNKWVIRMMIPRDLMHYDVTEVMAGVVVEADLGEIELDDANLLREDVKVVVVADVYLVKEDIKVVVLVGIDLMEVTSLVVEVYAAAGWTEDIISFTAFKEFQEMN
jgi:hypothetical protein